MVREAPDNAVLKRREDDQSLGTLLRAWRRRALLTQEELAQRAHVHPRTIRRIESDAVDRPRAASIRQLAQALALTPQEHAALSAAALRTRARGLAGDTAQQDASGGESEPSAVENDDDAELRGAGALTSPRRVPRQLPVGVSGFVGRAEACAELDRRLGRGSEQTAVCVISGMAGVGKTSLALHWAHQRRERFEDGELYVNLQGFGPSDEAIDPRDALLAFLDAMGVSSRLIPEDLSARAALYRTVLADKHVLIVLDNAQNVEQVRPLLPGGARCAVLITSRHQLSSLITENGAGLLSLDMLSLQESRDLLAHRVGRQRVEADPGATDEIIASCARLPLALAIVAGRAVTSPSLPLTALAADVRRAHADLDALTTADALTDVRRVLARSYDVLPDEVARMFRLLAVHPGPDISIRAAVSLMGGGRTRTRRLLDALVEAHLISEATHGRYTMHDLLRGFARQVARETDSRAELAAAAGRVSDHYVQTAYEAALRLHVPAEWLFAPGDPSSGVRAESLSDHRDALAWCQTEREVVLAVLRQALADSRYAHVIQLAFAFQFWLLRQGRWQEHVDCAKAALAAAVHLDDPEAQAAAHRSFVPAIIELGGFEQAFAHARRALSIARQFQKPAEEGLALFDIALVFIRQDHAQEALLHAEAALDPLRAAGLSVTEARILNLISWSRCRLGQSEEALRAGEKALAISIEVGDLFGQGIILDTLGYIHQSHGDHRAALAHYRRALSLSKDQGNRQGEAVMLLHVGDALEADGQRLAARHFWRLALAVHEELKHLDADEVRARLRSRPGPPVESA